MIEAWFFYAIFVGLPHRDIKYGPFASEAACEEIRSIVATGTGTSSYWQFPKCFKGVVTVSK